MAAPFRRSESAPVLLVFGPHAARMADLVRLRPSLLTRVAFAPRPAVHAAGAWLHLAPEAERSDAEAAAILDQSDPRDLLRSAIPDAPPVLYRALDRAGDQVRERLFYERISAICLTPFSEWLLAGDLDDARVYHAEALLEMDPAVVKIHAALPNPLYVAKNLDSVIRFLRAHGALLDGDLRLPPRSGLPAFVRRLQRALDRIPAPSPGFDLAPPFKIIPTVGELRRVGGELRNCLANPRMFATGSWFHLIEGSAVFIFCDEPPLLASVRQIAPNLWRLDQISGPNNKAVDDDTRQRLLRALDSSGVQLVRDDPSHALYTLWSHADRRRAADEYPADPDFEADDDDWAA